MAAYLFARYLPTLTLVHIIGLDHVRHRVGVDNTWARRAVAAADRAVGRVLETIERLGLRDRATVIVTGDHGSVDVHTARLPNVWLREGGVAPERPSANAWNAAFLASGGSALLRLQGSTTSPAATLEQVRRVLDALPAGVRTLFRTVERDELDHLGAAPDAALALAAVPGVIFSPDVTGTAIRAASGGGHGYHPELPGMMTGFVAAGAGLRRGAVVPMLPIEHVAPLIAALLRLDTPAMDGVLLPGVLSDDDGLST